MKTQMNLQFNLDHETVENDDDTDAVRLEYQMEEFKQDPEKMRELNEFLDEVLQKAQTEVDRKSASKVSGMAVKFLNASLINSFFFRSFAAE